MPIHDYKCLDCGEIAEVFLHGGGNEKSATCPACGSVRMERLFSASYLLQTETRSAGKTCCGRSERCHTPPCSTGDICSRR